MKNLRVKNSWLALICFNLLMSQVLAAGIDWSVPRGSADYAELKLARGVMSQARSQAGVALVDPMLNIATLNADSTDGGNLIASRQLSSEEFGFEFQNISWYQDAKWGVHARFGKYDDLEGLDTEGRPTGKFGAQMQEFSFSYTEQFANFHNIHIGTNLHFFNSRIATASSQAYYMDMALWMPVVQSLDYGLVIGNLGQGSSYDQREPTLPLYLQTGFAYKLPLIEVLDAQVLVDYKYHNDQGAFYYLGGRIAYQNFIAVHSAIPVIREDEDLLLVPKSVGIEVIYENITVNYAYQSVENLGGSHHIGLGIQFQ